MAQFPSTQPQPYGQDPNSVHRIGKRQILPGSIEPRHLDVSIISRSTTSGNSSPIAVANGATLTITTKTTSIINASVPLGSLGIGVCFFHDSLTTGNLIAPGTANYTIQGPVMMPTATPSTVSGVTYFSDGNDLVWRTALTNNTGSTQNILYLVDTRVLMAIGGLVQ